MKKSFFVSITTYNRPKALLQLLDDLVRCSRGLSVHVRVYDDASTEDYRHIAAMLQRNGWRYVRGQQAAGKKGYWRTVSRALQDAAQSGADYCIFLQDDLRLCSRFFDRAVELWRGLRDPKPVTLNLLRDAGDEIRWVAGVPAPRGAVDLTGWVDCAAFMYTPRTVALLGGLHDPQKDGDLSRCSGVGRQLTTRLRGRGGLYRVCHSLVVHLLGPSMLNPGERTAVPLTTVGFVDGDDRARHLERGVEHVEASLASIPSRIRSLAEVVVRLLPQVNRLNVYLNSYPTVPGFLDNPKVTVVRSQDCGDPGDAGKFHWVEDAHGYFLTCDDDIAYPPDYVRTLVNGIEKYGRRAVVGYHGHLLSGPRQSRHAIHFALGRPRDTAVHLLGTGVLGYHASTLRAAPSDFKAPNMADVWFALLCQQQQVPRVCLERGNGWLQSIDPNPDDSIYSCSLRGDGTAKDTGAKQAAILRNGEPWRLLGIPEVGGTAEEPSADRPLPFRAASVARPARRGRR